MSPLDAANAELMAEFRRICPASASPFALPAWYASLVRLHVSHAGPRAWGRLTKAERHARLLQHLRNMDPVEAGHAAKTRP